MWLDRIVKAFRLGMIMFVDTLHIAARLSFGKKLPTKFLKDSGREEQGCQLSGFSQGAAMPGVCSSASDARESQLEIVSIYVEACRDQLQNSLNKPNCFMTEKCRFSRERR